MAAKGRWRGAGLVGDVALAAWLLGGIVAVGVVGPERVTGRLTQMLGTVPSALAPPSAGGANAAAAPAAASPGLTRAVPVRPVTAAELTATLERLAAMPPRIPGYGGGEEAAVEIRDRFVDLGLSQVTVDTFQVTVPVDHGGRLEIDGTDQQVPLYALWPNGVRTPSTPPAGLSGHLIDAGRGALADLNGSRVDGAVALVGFGCDLEYLNVRALGATAILFYDDGRVDREQALDKFVRVSVDVPRYWVEAEAAARLLPLAAAGEVRVTVHSRMDWETVPAYNVYGRLDGQPGPVPGTASRQWRDDPLVLSAYYDAISVVPALARGAENACSVAALLHLAAALAADPPAHPVIFLATSGHFLGLAGVNDFLYRHARQSGFFRARLAAPIDFRLFVGLDLSSHCDQVAAFSQGTFYTGWATDAYGRSLVAPYAQRFARYAAAAWPDAGGTPRFVDAVAPSRQTWRDFMPVGLALDSEAATFVGLGALSLATPHDLRRRVDTPADLPGRVDVEALARQVETLAAILGAASRDPGLFVDTALELKDKGHSLGGRVFWFNRDVNFAVPQDPLPGAVVTYQQRGFDSIAGVRTLMTTQTDSSGRFRFDILRNTLENRVLAYKTDASGEIAWAPDLGSEGDAVYPVTQKYVWWEDEMVAVLFPCRGLSLLETVDSRQLVALDHVTVLGENDSPPQWYGEEHAVEGGKTQGKVAPAMVVYARPEARVKLLGGTGLAGVKYLLTNSPDRFLTDPVVAAAAGPAVLAAARGTGFDAGAGLIRCPLLRSATDMWIINDVRMKILERYGVRSERMSQLHARSRLALLAARQAWDRREYDRFQAAVHEAAGTEGRAYPDVQATASDTVNGIVFYFVLLLPFSFFAERLLVGAADIRRQLAGFAGIFLLVFLALHRVHPAFRLSTSPYIILLAFVILAMGTAVIGLILSRLKAQMQQHKRRAAGLYEADVGRLSATVAAVLLGISNLRKRPVRTGLTATTLVLVSFTALSFTSISTTIQFYRLPRAYAPAYDGALVRGRDWGALHPAALDQVRSAFGDSAVIAPRSWFLLPDTQGRAQIELRAVGTERAAMVYGVVGLTARESRLLPLADLLLPGGRWFAGEDERDKCILPTDLAELLGVRPADVGQARIRALGRTYTVVGLVDAARLNRLVDLDGEKLTPVDMVTEATVTTTSSQQVEVVPTAPVRSFVHLEAGNVLLLPYAETCELGGSLRSVAVGGFRGDLPRTIESFVTRVALPVFVGHQGRVTVYSSLGTATFAGFGSLLVPLLIAALIVLNTMLGSVYERAQEIGIYSSLGLTPLHVAALFLAEASVFATFGAVLGYLAGQAVALVLARLGWLQGMTLNYSSLSAIWATAVVMLTVFLSTLYPAKRAADMTVPDVTRRWRFAEPDGDQWSFDFPFTVAGHEVLALYAYLTQVFRSYGEGSIGEFVTEDVRFSVTESGLPSGGPSLRIDLRAWLAPYDLGIAQSVRMEAVPTGDRGIYRIAMGITRLSGDTASWKRINRRFLNVLRKRFLVWRTVPAQVRQQYTVAGEQLAAAAGRQPGTARSEPPAVPAGAPGAGGAEGGAKC